MVRAIDRSEFIPQQWIDLRMECVALNAVGMDFPITSFGLHYITFNDMKFNQQSINDESNSLIFKRFFFAHFRMLIISCFKRSLA